MTRFFHGTRADFDPGDLIEPTPADTAGSAVVYLTRDLDAAIWEAELAGGESPARVYIVEPTSQIETESNDVGQVGHGHPSMNLRSREPLRVMDEVTTWTLYHGTRADLKPGDLIKPGHDANFGHSPRAANFVYVARTLDAAIWGAELSAGDGPGRIYIVEPTGPVEDDPNLTDRKFRGNPTGSFRSRAPFRVVAELKVWQGHSAQAVQAMKDGLERLRQRGVEPLDD